MCGLVGLAGTIGPKQKDVFNELLLVDVVRGGHSTGAACVKRFDSEIIVAKAPVASPYFLALDEYKSVINQNGVKVLIGHNRYATVGSKTAENAHPFMFENLVGAHNGTIDDWSLRTLDNARGFGTDSEALYYNIHKHGLKPIIGGITGAWALTYYDKANQTMNLLRNLKRPLFYTYSSDRETLYWASEADMLEWVLKRNGVKLFEDSVYECEADHHYKWVLPVKMGDKFEKPVLTKTEGHSSFFKSSGSRPAWEYWGEDGYSSYSYGGNTTSHTIKPKSDLALLPKPQPKPVVVHKKVDTKKFRPPYKDAYGRIINKENFEKLVKSGCVYCDGNDTEWGEYIHPLKNDMDGRKLYLCEQCYEDEDIRLLVEHCI